jgi:5-methylcytosine-specific restriction endonuclease McrBC regulatory subunit McrC
MVLWNVTECSFNFLSGFELEWLPDGLPYQIKQFRSGGRVGLEIDTLVGSIPLKNGDTLQILPKAGTANFLRMLFEASFADDAVTATVPGVAAYQSSEELTLAILVARPFVNTLGVIAANSFQFNWKRNIERDSFLAGDVELMQTVVGLRTRSERPFVFHRNRRTYDTAENRTVVTAAMIVAREFERVLTSQDRSFLKSFIHRLALAPATQADVERVKTNIKLGAYSGARGYYKVALRLALIILGQQGFRQGERAELNAEPVLFNSAAIFEEFVRNAIARTYQQRGLNVRKGFFPPLSLFKDGTISLSPDIVIARDEYIKLVADVKYKIGSVTAADYYQMHAYAKRVSAKFAVLFCAAENSAPSSVQRASNLDVAIIEVMLPLSELDTAVQCLQQLESWVPQFRP